MVQPSALCHIAVTQAENSLLGQQDSTQLAQGSTSFRSHLPCVRARLVPFIVSFSAFFELSREIKKKSFLLQVPVTKYSSNSYTVNIFDVLFKANSSKQDTVNETQEKQEVK